MCWAPVILVIDGGNSRYTEDGPHAKLLGDKGINFIDAGVSGGVWGLHEGYGLMVGGSDADVARAMPIFDTLRPEGDVADGFVHAGPVGAGHYAKMVHNGIEYGLMHAYAEGYELLAAEELITDPQAVIQAWTNGTVVRSWLQQLLAKALKEDPGFSAISGYTEDSGEGRWTVEEAISHRVPMPVIAASLFARFGLEARGLPHHESRLGPCVTSSVDMLCTGSASPVRRNSDVCPSPGTDRLPVLGTCRARARARPHGVRRIERFRQDESR